MPKQPMCADNLFLLGELLQGAGEYVTRSRHQAGDEDRFMIELAREQIPHLRLALRNMERSLAELDRHLKLRLGSGEAKIVDEKEDDSAKKSERRYKKASSGG
jgi:hypothetical protein